MLLENIGRDPRGKRTIHINIKFFFVENRVKSREEKIKDCPTYDMIQEYLTKPLQGAKFRKFW